MKVVGFSASPRAAGNTAWVVDKIFEGAKEQGAETQSWYFSDLDIKPCRACNGCKKGDRGCVLNDDMQKIYAALDQADALVLGSPVYMAQMSAQAKIFTDRLYARFMPRFSPFFRENGKKLQLAFTQGNPDAGLFKEYFDCTAKMFQMLEFEVKPVQVVAGTRKEPAQGRADLPAVLKGAGAALVAG